MSRKSMVTLTDDPRLIVSDVPDAAARDMLVSIWDLMQVLDDLIDKDKPLEDAQVGAAFMAALELPLNPFYARYQGVFLPLLQSIYVRWVAATLYERERRSIEKAYMLRAGFYDLIAMTYYILLGPAKAWEYAAPVYDRYGETLEDLRVEVSGNA